MRRRLLILVGWIVAAGVLGDATVRAAEPATLRDRVAQYATVRLDADLDALTPAQRKVLPLLIHAAEQMDIIFWREAYGDREALLQGVQGSVARQFVTINYGPWDRMDNDRPVLPGVKAKPAGANFYPPDMTKSEFTNHLRQHPEDKASFTSLYTVVRRDSEGRLKAIPYHTFFAEPTNKAAGYLSAAAELAEDPGLRKYLVQRARALKTDEYRASDMTWLDMKTNTLDIVIGPIETYEDQLFGYKASHEAYVLIKDRAWSRRLSRYARLLPELQRRLPVASAYRQETPGTDSDLNAYDVVYYAGDCNAGSKTIAINLPNDEQVQLTKGTRRLQLKNAMRAKFDGIMVPLANTLIVKDQRSHVTFEAFFGNTMFHEVAHGLGIKNTINGRGTVRRALQELAPAMEEGKADVLGLFLVQQLVQQGVLTEGRLMDNYVTFVASIFRSIRFGASSAHGRANLLRFNFFRQRKAFTRTKDGLYRISPSQMKAAVEELSGRILRLQGDGDYDGTQSFMRQFGTIGPDLQQDLERLNQRDIPVDVVFEQGLSVLGLDE